MTVPDRTETNLVEVDHYSKSILLERPSTDYLLYSSRILLAGDLPRIRCFLCDSAIWVLPSTAGPAAIGSGMESSAYCHTAHHSTVGVELVDC